MHQVHLWETHDFTVTILKSTLASLGKVTLLLLTVVTLRLLGVRRHPIVQITSASPVLFIYHVFMMKYTFLKMIHFQIWTFFTFSMISPMTGDLTTISRKSQLFSSKILKILKILKKKYEKKIFRIWFFFSITYKNSLARPIRWSYIIALKLDTTLSESWAWEPFYWRAPHMVDEQSWKCWVFCR